MERFTIGQCRTGKTITSHPDLDGLDTNDEIFDAMAVLSLLATRERRRKRNSIVTKHLADETEKLVRKLVEADQWQNQMEKVGAATSIDIRDHALRLLRPEFKV